MFLDSSMLMACTPESERTSCQTSPNHSEHQIYMLVQNSVRYFMFFEKTSVMLTKAEFILKKSDKKNPVKTVIF